MTADWLFQDRVWANVAKCLNCVIAMVDKLQEEDNSSKQEPVPEQQLADVITSHNPGKSPPVFSVYAGNRADAARSGE